MAAAARAAPEVAPDPEHHLGIVGAFVLIIVISAVASSGGTSNTPSAATTTPAAATNQPAPQVTDASGETCSSFDAQGGYCPGDDPSPSPAAPQYTASQQAAIQDANSYLSSEPGFSYEGLIGQLEFDKFTPAQASYGAQSVGLGSC